MPPPAFEERGEEGERERVLLLLLLPRGSGGKRSGGGVEHCLRGVREAEPLGQPRSDSVQPKTFASSFFCGLGIQVRGKQPGPERREREVGDAVDLEGQWLGGERQRELEGILSSFLAPVVKGSLDGPTGAREDARGPGVEPRPVGRGPPAGAVPRPRRQRGRRRRRRCRLFLFLFLFFREVSVSAFHLAGRRRRNRKQHHGPGHVRCPGEERGLGVGLFFRKRRGERGRG